MNPELDKARAELAVFLERCEGPDLGRLTFDAAVSLAQEAESLGNGEDTRTLGAVLTASLERSFHTEGEDVALLSYAAPLLAVLSDLADDGDETAAEMVSACSYSLPAHIVQMGRDCAAARRQAVRR